MAPIITHWVGKDKPNGKFCFPQLSDTMCGVKTIDETRREKLGLLLKKHGSFAELNEAIGYPRTDSRLSRIKNQNARTDREGKTFLMGSPMAREIEVALGLPNGWMDTPLTYAELARDYRMLEADAAEQTTWTADNLALFESRFHRLQATEPATLGALVTQCHNELAAGMGAHGHITPLRWHERMLKNWLDFDQSLAQSAKT